MGKEEAENLATSEEKKVEEEEKKPVSAVVQAEKPTEAVTPVEPEVLEKLDEMITQVEEEKTVVATSIPLEKETPAEFAKPAEPKAAVPTKSQKVDTSEQKKPEVQERELAKEEVKVTENTSKVESRWEEPTPKA